MKIFNETNELAEKISSLLNKEGIESELGAILVYILEEADEHLMKYLEDQAEAWQWRTTAGHSTSPTVNWTLQTAAGTTSNGRRRMVELPEGSLE